MTTRNALIFAAAALVGLAGAASAHARGGHFHGHGRAHVGVFIGAPVFAYGYGYRPYYYPPYYYPPYPYPYAVPAPVVAQPPVYVERQDQQAAEAPSASDAWYYCPDTKSYYPYVGTCASPWQRVAPQTPPQS